MDPEHLLESGWILLLAAHPDDETIGAGGQLDRWKDRLLIVHATDGAPADRADAEKAGFATPAAYAKARREELLCAMSLAGIAEDRRRELGAVDGRAVDAVAELTFGLGRIVEEFQPSVLLTHPYEGGHPDHDACALIARLVSELSEPAPAVLEFTSYHALGEQMVAGEFLADVQRREIEFVLDEEQRSRKRAMFDCYRSQKEILSRFPIDVERFREAPVYNFAAPPHRGRLNYENWGFMDGNEWRERAARAVQGLSSQHATYRT